MCKCHPSKLRRALRLTETRMAIGAGALALAATAAAATMAIAFGDASMVSGFALGAVAMFCAGCCYVIAHDAAAYLAGSAARGEYHKGYQDGYQDGVDKYQ